MIPLFAVIKTKVRMATYGGICSAESPSRGSPKFTFFSVGGCDKSLLTGFANMLGGPIFLFFLMVDFESDCLLIAARINVKVKKK